jgi:hypothetical protein
LAISSARTKIGPHVYSDAHHCVSVCANVILTYSIQPPNAAYLDAWTKATNRLLERSDQSISVITVIDSGTKAPDEVSKRAIRNAITKHCDHIKGFAYVVEGRGFGAAAMRSALSLINLAARYPFPQKVFATVQEAAIWIVHRTPTPEGVELTPEKLVAVAETMRSQIRPAVAVPFR